MSVYDRAKALFKSNPELWDVALSDLGTWSEEAFEESFDDEINETETVKVYGYEFIPSEVLKKLDPTAYRDGLLTHIDSLPVVEIDGHYFNEDELENFIDQYNSAVRDDHDFDAQ